MIRFHCPSCNLHLEVDDTFAGATADCPGCQESITAPSLPIVESAPEAEQLNLLESLPSKKATHEPTPKTPAATKQPIEDKAPKEEEPTPKETVSKYVESAPKITGKDKPSYRLTIAATVLFTLIVLSLFLLMKKEPSHADAPKKDSNIAAKPAVTEEETPAQEALTPITKAETLPPPIEKLPEIPEAPEVLPETTSEPVLVKPNLDKAILVKPKRKISPELIIQENIYVEGEAPELELPK